MIKDNKRLDAIISDLEDAQDGNILSVPREVREAQRVEEVPEEASVSLSGFQPELPQDDSIYRCNIDGCKRFFDSTLGLSVHRKNGHKGGGA